ncbi:DUF4055 domain-containing protein [Erwiniaceae bacterium L1_54_6]|nr:DUF4055 domain-containing protein [Erwiniaceae bacterium L1_54_6]
MADSVRKQSLQIEEMAEYWPMIHALMGGTKAMRDAGKTFLPQWPNEQENDYKTRLSVATLFPAYERTISVLCSKPFSRPITWTDIEDETVKMFDDIDLEGSTLSVFAHDIMCDAMAYGISGILVDYPSVDGTKTVAEEKKLGLRPYMAKIKARSILGYSSKRINGVEVMTMLRYVETVTEEDPTDEFTEKVIEQVRVIEPSRWRVFRKKKAENSLKEEWLLHQEGVNTLGKVPFVPVYGNRTGFMRGKPPLRDLAFLNVEHWQSKSDQQTILHVARVPILFGKCLGDGPITVGASSAVIAQNQDADMKFIEHSGKAIAAGREELLDLEDRMRQVGAELLVVKPGRMTVAQNRAEDEPGTCALQRIVQDLESSFNQAIALLYEWRKRQMTGAINIFNEFGVSSMTDATAQLLLDMNIANKLSNATLFREIKRRGILGDDAEWETEEALIKKQPLPPDKSTTLITA